MFRFLLAKSAITGDDKRIVAGAQATHSSR